MLLRRAGRHQSAPRQQRRTGGALHQQELSLREGQRLLHPLETLGRCSQGSRIDQVSPATAKRVERIGGDALFSVPNALALRELFARLVP